MDTTIQLGDTIATKTEASAYALTAPALIAAGYSAVPIMPGAKRPGLGPDRGLVGWERFCDEPPRENLVAGWSRSPDLGVGVALGFRGVVAIDIDSDDPAVASAVDAIAGVSPVRKRGRKGFTAFFRASPAVRSRPFKFANGDGVDLLAHGRQTVLPPSIHPSTGQPYQWTTADALEHVTPENLPELPDDIADQLAGALAPFGYVAEPERPKVEYTAGRNDEWTETNAAALADLSAWVPALGIGAKRKGASWRAQAKWRNGDGFNVGFNQKGIRDFSDDVGYSAIDIVAKVANCEPHEAMRMLRDKLGLRDPDPVEFRLKMRGDAGEPGVSDAASELVGDAPEPGKPPPLHIPDDAALTALYDKYGEDAMEVHEDAASAVMFAAGGQLARKLVPAEMFARHFIEAVIVVGRIMYIARRIGPVYDENRVAEAFAAAIRMLDRQAKAAPATPAARENSDLIPPPKVNPFDPSAAGGLLQKTAEWIYRISFVPSRELSMLAALGVMAAFLSRRYVGPTGLSPNLYLIGLAGTTRGKDGPLSAAMNFLATTAMTHLLGSGDITSDRGFEKLVRRKPACLLPMDEIGSWLEEGSGRGAPPHAKARRKALLTLYTKSKENSVFLGKDDAGPDAQGSDNPVYMPCVSILGVSTLTTFFNGLKEENTSDGLVARLTVVLVPPGEGDLSEPNYELDTSVPIELQQAYTAALEAWPVKGSLAALNAKNPLARPALHKVPFADDAARQAFGAVRLRERTIAVADPSLEGSVGRAAEQTLKLAMIRAVSRNFATPVITAQDLAYGSSLVWVSARMMREGMTDYLAGSDFENRCKTILRVLKDAGAEGIAAYKLRRRAVVRAMEPRHYEEAVKFLTNYKHWQVVKGKTGERYVTLHGREPVED